MLIATNSNKLIFFIALQIIDIKNLVDQSFIFNIEPSDTLSFVPLAVLDLTLARVVDAEAVLLTILPGSVVLTTIRPGEYTMTLLLIVNVLSLVLPAI